MMKWNLFNLFSLMDAEQQEMPELKNRCRISSRRVKNRVMTQLPEEQTESVHERAWKIGRVPAVVTAAVLVVSGSFVTAAAASGGFQNLYARFFGDDTTYTESVQNSYNMPNAVIQNTLENVQVDVMGIFGDGYNTYASLDLYGINGYTLPETVDFAEMDCRIEGKDDFIFYGGSYGGAYEDGHYYIDMRMNADDKVLGSDATLTIELRGLADRYVRPTSGRMLGYAMGWTAGQINTRKAYTAEEQQWIDDNYITYNEEKDTGVGDYYYYARKELLDCGTVTIRMPMEYSETDMLQKSVVIGGVDVQMEISPFAAQFTWDPADGCPFDTKWLFATQDGDWFCSESGYAQLADGTTTPTSGDTCGGSGNTQIEGGKNRLCVRFLRPVEPEAVTAVYENDGTCIWTADE